VLALCSGANCRVVHGCVTASLRQTQVFDRAIRDKILNMTTEWRDFERSGLPGQSYSEANFGLLRAAHGVHVPTVAGSKVAATLPLNRDAGGTAGISGNRPVGILGLPPLPYGTALSGGGFLGSKNLGLGRLAEEVFSNLNLGSCVASGGGCSIFGGSTLYRP